MDISPTQVHLLGKAAHDWLSSDQRGKVLAVVTHADYLLTEAEELVWLATPETPMHRRCIQVSPPLPRLAVGSAFTVKGQFMEFGSGSSIDLGSLRTWKPNVLPASDLIEIKLLPEKLNAVCQALLAQKAAVGFGRWIPAILQIAENQDFSAGIRQENSLIQAAWPIIASTTRACLSHNFSLVMQLSEALIGLGAGLTPSGDDFLGGLFFGRTILSCYYPQLHYLHCDPLHGWIDSHKAHTNRISFALLKDNALGHAPEPLSRFGAAILTNQSINRATTSACALTNVGHCTGWDLLTGFVAGMLLAFKD